MYSIGKTTYWIEVDEALFQVFCVDDPKTAWVKVVALFRVPHRKIFSGVKGAMQDLQSTLHASEMPGKKR